MRTLNSFCRRNCYLIYRQSCTVLDLERACVRILSTCMTEMIPRLRWIDEGLDDAFFCVKVLAQRRNSVLSTFIKSMEQVLILRMDAKPPTEVPFLDSRLLECLQDCIGVLRPHTTGQVLRISSGLERGEWRTGGRNFLVSTSNHGCVRLLITSLTELSGRLL